jgi:hypothetical protein
MSASCERLVRDWAGTWTTPPVSAQDGVSLDEPNGDVPCPTMAANFGTGFLGALGL